MYLANSQMLKCLGKKKEKKKRKRKEKEYSDKSVRAFCGASVNTLVR